MIKKKLGRCSPSNKSAMGRSRNLMKIVLTNKKSRLTISSTHSILAHTNCTDAVLLPCHRTKRKKVRVQFVDIDGYTFYRTIR